MSETTNIFEKFESLKKINITDENELKRIYDELLAMDISSKEQVLAFQKRRDLIEKHRVNEWSESYFLMTTDVASEKKKKRQEHYEQVLDPINQEYEEKLNKKFLESSAAQKLEAPFHILRRNQKSEIEIFSPKNIELNKEMNKISMEITEIQGKLMANWEGKETPLPALYPYMEQTDRQTRKKAFECMKNSDLSVVDMIDEKFDRLLELRQETAKNVGFDNYIDYRFKELQRFDWNQSDCFEFHTAVKKYILPLSSKLLEQRKTGLNLETIRPYDMGVDIFGREPLKIYEKGDSTGLIEGAGKIIKAIDEELYGYFLRIKENNLLDLNSRENKAPGGYMTMYPVFEQASVFYNGAGMSSDLMVLLHELGHCFHYFLGKEITPYALQNWTSEVAEAGSMSMEYIGLEKMENYLDPKKCKRMKDDKLRQIIGLFVNCSRGDEFQHWIYDNPGHSVQMRRDKWIELMNIYSSGVNTEGYQEQLSKTGWQFAHILQMPFYLIDYAISELLALTIWDRYKTDSQDGITHYKQGCSLAASKTVPEIYQAFGTKLSFGEDVIAPLAKRLQTELKL